VRPRSSPHATCPRPDRSELVTRTAGGGHGVHPASPSAGPARDLVGRSRMPVRWVVHRLVTSVGSCLRCYLCIRHSGFWRPVPSRALARGRRKPRSTEHRLYLDDLSTGRFIQAQATAALSSTIRPRRRRLAAVMSKCHRTGVFWNVSSGLLEGSVSGLVRGPCLQARIVEDFPAAERRVGWNALLNWFNWHSLKRSA
jgi:hypothetical protein